MNDCDRFMTEVSSSLGVTLNRLGYIFKFSEQVDGCRLYYWSPGRTICVYESLRNGDVNCLVFDTNRPDSTAQDWVPLRMAIGYGEGLSDSELEALMPDDFPSNEEILQEIGEMLLRLPTAQ